MTNDPQQSPPTADPDKIDAGEPVDLESLVDDLELKVASEADNPLEKIAEIASGDGTDRPGEDAEPPA